MRCREPIQLLRWLVPPPLRRPMRSQRAMLVSALGLTLRAVRASLSRSTRFRSLSQLRDGGRSPAPFHDHAPPPAALRTLAFSTGGLALRLGAQTPAPSEAPAAPATVPSPAPAAPETEQVFKLPPLGYNYDALEPLIDAETMKLHHDKHHASYVSKLNQALADVPSAERKPVEELLGTLEALPAEVRTEVRNQGGGHANHSLFWQTLKKNDGARPGGTLAKEMEKAFGSYDDFWKLFSGSALGIFGSGWAWLAWRDRKLTIEPAPNQDSPWLTGGMPLLGLDVWEHAYYLKYQNRRADYVAAFQQAIDWKFVEERLAKVS